MSALTQLLKRHSLVAGLALMFLLTWPIDLSNSGVFPFQVPFAVYILVGYGFVIACIAMTGMTLGKDAVIALLKRFLIWRVGWIWYLVAFLPIPGINLLAVYLNAAWSRTPVDFSIAYAYEIFGPSANLLVLIVPFFLFDALTNGEEIGWRGYILPRLQAKYSALSASLIIGIVWSLWHIPKFVSHWNTVPFVWYMIETMAKAVLLTWLYNNTKGSLLLATLFHASINTAGVFLPVANLRDGNYFGVSIIVALLTVVAAIMVAVLDGSGNLSRTKTSQLQSLSHS